MPWHDSWLAKHFAEKSELYGDIFDEISFGNTFEVRKCLANKVDPNEKGRNRYEDTPLMMAVKHNHSLKFPIVKMLVGEYGAFINKTNKIGETPLHYACYHGNFVIARKCVEYLVECGADVHMYDKNGLTALAVASYMGNAQLVVSLTNAGAKVYAKRRTDWTITELGALDWAEEGNKPVRKVLKGAMKIERKVIREERKLKRQAKKQKEQAALAEQARKEYQKKALLDQKMKMKRKKALQGNLKSSGSSLGVLKVKNKEQNKEKDRAATLQQSSNDGIWKTKKSLGGALADEQRALEKMEAHREHKNQRRALRGNEYDDVAERVLKTDGVVLRSAACWMDATAVQKEVEVASPLIPKINQRHHSSKWALSFTEADARRYGQATVELDMAGAKVWVGAQDMMRQLKKVEGKTLAAIQKREKERNAIRSRMKMSSSQNDPTGLANA